MHVSFGAALIGLSLLMPATGQCGITIIQDYDGTGTIASNVFRQPSFSGSTGGFIAATPNIAAPSADKAFSGTKSLNVQWAFATGDPKEWLRLTTSGSSTFQGNPVIDAAGALTMKVFLATEDPLAVCLGVRERGYASDPPLGSVGAGTANGIEWLGATGAVSGVPTCTRLLTPGVWQDLTFILPNEPVVAFAGTTANGILEPHFGKVDLEQLAFVSPTHSTKPVNLYIDDIQVRSLDAVPEPGSFALLATGLLPLLGLRRKNR